MLRILILPLFLSISSLFAQVEVRPDDHFWRKQVVSRIDFKIALNKPLVAHRLPDNRTMMYFSEYHGLVASLIHGLREGKYTAYYPEDLNKAMDNAQFEKRLKNMEHYVEKLSAQIDSSENYRANAFEEAFNSHIPEPVYESSSEKKVNLPRRSFAYDPSEEPVSNDWMRPHQDKEQDLLPFEQSVRVVEEWIFDKNRSVATRNVQYFELIWTDPSGLQAEKVVAAFKYSDVKGQLEQTLWLRGEEKQEIKNLRQIFDSHQFFGTILHVSGKEAKNPEAAEKMRKKMQDYENELWIIWEGAEKVRRRGAG